MAKKWITRVLVLLIVGFVMFKTKGLFDDLADGTFAHEVLTYENVYGRSESEGKQNNTSTANAEISTSTDTTTSVSSVTSADVSASEPEVTYELSEKTGDDFYIDLSHYVVWESGEYSKDSGEKADNKRRLRYPELIQIECPKYLIQLSDGYKLRVCEYNEAKEFIRSISLENGDSFLPTKDGEFFSVSIIKKEGEKSMSLGQWSAAFSKGVELIICTEKWIDYSVSDLGNLITGSTNGLKGKSLSDLLLMGQDRELSSALWAYQIESGIYSLNGEELNNGNPTYYVSSSEGDENNSGLNPENPKKKLDGFSGMSNVNILLKCGDTFKVSKEIRLGSNCIYAAYGDGERPVLDYYRELKVSFSPSDGIKNVWEADLSGLEIANGAGNKNNCNIGQLLIDGTVNWKRYVWSSKEKYNPKYIRNRGNGAWAVDWTTSKLYLYSETDPNNFEIKYAPPVTALDAKKIKNTVVKGIEVTGAGCHGLNMEDCENVTVSSCYIHDIGGSVHTQSGMRYGNAFQIWNSGKDIVVCNNFASWIFDTCFTNQGYDKTAENEHIHFRDNIGAHFYWGIEVWGDGYSSNPFNDVTYTDNVLYDNIDLTNPTTPMQAGKNSRPLETTDKEYVSYRTGYKYHQMSSINVSNSGTGHITKIENNIVWNSNRFLVWASNSRKEEKFSALMNNLLYADNALEKACLFRYTNNDEKLYLDKIDNLDSSNKWSIHYKNAQYDNSEELAQLEAKLNKIAGK